MASFISALSLFVLALISGCFTLPIGETFFSQTSSPFDSDVTTGFVLNERMVSEDAIISSTEGMMTDDATREARMLDESFTFMPTTEGSSHERREFEDSTSEMTVEPTTEHVELALRDITVETEIDNATELFTASSPRKLHSDESVLLTTEFIPSKVHFDDSVLLTTESLGESQTSEHQMTTIKPRMIEPEMHMDLTTESMSMFTSTSSAAAPELYTRDPSTTRKYTGLLTDKDDQPIDSDNEEEHKKVHGKDTKHTEEIEKVKDEKHSKEEIEVEEHTEEIEHKEFSGKHTKQEDEKSEIDEHKHDKEDVEEHTKEVEHKEFSGKHAKQEDEKSEMEEPKHDKEEVEEHTEEIEHKKLVGKHTKHEVKSDKDDKEEVEEHTEDDEEKKFHKGHKSEVEEVTKSGEKESSEEKKPSFKPEEEPKQEGEDEEEDVAPNKFMSKRPTTRQRPQVESDDKVPYAKAVYDQDAWKHVVKVPSDFAVLDESSDVVTASDALHSPKFVENYTEESKLKQGSTLLLFLLAALLFCACLTASTLAFVKNRHALNRKSRITEMEAHLDEHYPHHSHPFLFHQHHDK